MSVPPNSKCLVIGSSNPSSVGYACALALFRAGAAHVTVMGRDEDRVTAAMNALAADAEGKGNASGVLGDLKKPETMGTVVKKAVELMGGLDILVVSGANGYSEYLGLDPDDPASYRMMYDVGVLSPMMLAEAAIPYLAKSTASPGGGTVVMVSSVAAQVPWPDTAPFNYAKAAQNAMIETLAFKYRAGNVRVNGVLPGAIHSGALDVMATKKNVEVGEYAKLRGDAHPMERCGTPQDVANAVLYLASPSSGFTTGELLKVDGGLHLSSWFNRPKLLNEYVGGTKAT